MTANPSAGRQAWTWSDHNPAVVAATSRGRVVIVVVALAAGGVWWLVPAGALPPLSLDVVDLALFVMAAAILERLTIRTTDGREVNTAIAIVAAAAILGAAPPVVALIGMLGALLGAGRGRGLPSVDALVGRGLAGWSLSGVAGLGMASGPPAWDGSSGLGAPASIDAGAAIAVAVAVLLAGPILRAIGGHRSWRHLLPRVVEAIIHDVARQAAIVSTAVLGALVHPVLGPWTLPTMLVPLAAVRIGLDRQGQVARAYEQTIRAMSRLPEQLGELEPGHGVRVAHLARAVARELGLDATAVREVGQAAYLHELGRIQLERPDSAAMPVPAGRAAIAAAGAGVLRRAQGLEQVAAVVAGHGDLRSAAPDAIRAARIVAACCDIDRYAPLADDPGQRHEVVVRLVREIGDLEVVAAVDRVLDRTRPGEPGAPMGGAAS